MPRRASTAAVVGAPSRVLESLLNRRAFFLHIPKTGGTSLSAAVDQLYSHDEILPAQTWNHLLASTPSGDLRRIRGLASDFRLIRGHFGWSGLREIGWPVFTIAVLRDPISRAVSQLNHILHDPITNNWVNRAPDGLRLGVAGFLRSSIYWRRFFSNTQARYLIVDFDVRSRALRSHGGLLDAYRYDSSPEFLGASVSAPRALRRLLNISVVGTQQHLQETMLVASFKLRLPPVSVSTHRMKIPLDDRLRNLDVDAQRLLDEANDVDRVLFRAASARIVMDYAAVARAVVPGCSGSAGRIWEAREQLNHSLFERLGDRFSTS